MERQKISTSHLPIDTPAWEPQRLIFPWEMAPIRIWSNARVKKAAKVLANAMVRLLAAQPNATLTYSTKQTVSTSLVPPGIHDSMSHFETHHVLLSYVTLYITVWMCLLEDVCESRVLSVSIQDNHTVVSIS